MTAFVRNANVGLGHGAFVLVDNGPDGQLAVAAIERILSTTQGTSMMAPFAPNRGFGEACNVGAATAPMAGAILLVNPDAEIATATVEGLLDALNSHPCVGIVSARLVDRSGDPVETGGHFPTVAGLAVGKVVRLRGQAVDGDAALRRQVGAVHAVDWVSGAVMMVRREAWDAVGGFDPAFFLYYEDIDLCRRVRAAGWEVGIARDAVAIHESGGSQWRPGTRSRVERIYFESQAYYFRKHHGRLMEWLLRAVRLPYLATGMRRRYLERHGARIPVASDGA